MSFELGRVVATSGALEDLKEGGVSPISLINRHLSGDWGDLKEEDKASNDLALREGARILSAYDLPEGKTIWIITEAVGDSGHRDSTCILRPTDY